MPLYNLLVNFLKILDCLLPSHLTCRQESKITSPWSNSDTMLSPAPLLGQSTFRGCLSSWLPSLPFTKTPWLHLISKHAKIYNWHHTGLTDASLNGESEKEKENGYGIRHLLVGKNLGLEFWDLSEICEIVWRMKVWLRLLELNF